MVMECQKIQSHKLDVLKDPVQEMR
uniref:Uncharacterized protein n=1 Tax=Arundo donax TaxID=35708 RepID=A0A0A9EFI9_ARUDO